MPLKDQIDLDNSKVFLNKNEFAETHLIGGVQVDCVCTEDTANRIKEGVILGNTEADMIIYGLTVDLQYSPEDYVNVDGREYRVTKAAHAMGMTELALNQTLGM